MTTETNDLIAEVTQLPVQPGAAMRLLWMLEDPRTSAADLGRLIESDPSLSTQVIRLANTAFYGLSGKVSSAWRAVTVLGLATVRALATTAAFDLFSEKGRSVPDDFWPHSVTSAAAAATLARRVGIQSNEAFSAGLLHDIGSALVFRRAPRRYDNVLERQTRDASLTLVEAEKAEFGVTHAEVGAAALSTMRFPADMVEAINQHHTDPAEVTSLLGRLLVTADALAIAVDGITSEQNHEIGPCLESLDIPANSEQNLLEEIARDQENLAGFLTVKG
ncbi:MAG TPA: HDOD domain-containing protein [Acidimicrobiia bacterium]|nr:HDOD domain-containing protein [Acidimicrobiia bacterium]